MTVMVTAAGLKLSIVTRLPTTSLFKPPGVAAIGVLGNFARANPFIAYMFYPMPDLIFC
jgi:hypothetical protein